MNTDGHTWASLDSTESTPDLRGKGMGRARAPPQGAPSRGPRSGHSRSGGRGRCSQGACSPCTGQAPGSACAGSGRPCSAFPSTQGGARRG